MQIVLVIVRLSIVGCEVLNGCLCSSGPSTDVTISDCRDRSRADLVHGSNVSRAASFLCVYCILILNSTNVSLYIF